MKKLPAISLAVALALAAISQTPRFIHADPPADQIAVADKSSLADLAAQAINADSAIAKPAIEKLRAAGPAGLDALMTANQGDIAVHRGGAVVTASAPVDAAWPRITAAIDAVAAQRDAYASGLYWYTDLPTAEAAARKANKPILSLRLLGNLNDEYSCANSRFFRTVLYANADVSKYLREHFILHWQSVRPVPIITIDFGDGRKIQRTITGNSIHYVLTADGKVVDGIPGLYGAKAFLRELAAAEDGVERTLTENSPDETRPLADWHQTQINRINAEFADDCEKAAVVALPAPGAPTAVDASRRAVGKSTLERPIVKQIQRSGPASADSAGGSKTIAAQRIEDLTDSDWNKIATLHTEDATLDAGSRALMAAKYPTAAAAAPRAMSKMLVESPLVRAMRNFQWSIAQDTVRNEYQFHLQIHRWLADPSQRGLVNDVSALNKRVYAELFLTPDSDPWLGLVPADTYSALDDDGVCPNTSPGR